VSADLGVKRRSAQGFSNEADTHFRVTRHRRPTFTFYRLDTRTGLSVSLGNAYPREEHRM
jgi:hypothetical protein